MLSMDAHQMQSYNVELSLQLQDTTLPASEQKYDLKNPLYRCANHHSIPIPSTVPPLNEQQSAVALQGLALGAKRTAANMTNSVDTDTNGTGMEIELKRSKV